MLFWAFLFIYKNKAMTYIKKTSHQICCFDANVMKHLEKEACCLRIAIKVRSS